MMNEELVEELCSELQQLCAELDKVIAVSEESYGRMITDQEKQRVSYTMSKAKTRSDRQEDL